jgi:hypothetical protein
VRMGTVPCSRNIRVFLQPGLQNANEIHLVAPTGLDHDASAFELEFEGLALAA